MSNVQPPRHSDEAEAAVISALLLDGASGSVLAEVRDAGLIQEHFFQAANRIIFNAICTMADTGARIDTVSLLHHLRDIEKEQQVGGSPYLLQLMDATPTIGNAIEHARLLRNLYRMRQVTAFAQRMDADARATPISDDVALQQWLEKTEADFSELAHGTITTTLVPLGEVVVGVHNKVVQARSGVSIGISTGFKDLDHQIGGGWHPTEKVALAGRPGMGKTGFAITAGMKVAKQGYGVAFFSLEQPKEQIALRVLANEASLDLTRLREGKISASELTKFSKAVDRVGSLPFFVDDTSELSPLAMRNRLKKFQRDIRLGRMPQVTQGAIGLTILDYLQLQTPSHGNTRNREQDVASLTRENKQTCNMLSVAMLELSQLNRDVEKRSGPKRPQLSDLRESGAIEQDADVVMFLYRPEYYDPRDPLLKGFAEAIVAKQRHGPTGVVKLAFQAECARFENHVDDDQNFYGAAGEPQDWGFEDGF